MLNITNDRLIHSLKTALACFVGFVVTRFTHFYIDQWLVITILVVMCAQINVGSIIQKSYMRFLGTVVGSLLALITLLLFQHNELAYAAVVTFAGFVFSYIATSQASYNEAGTLGAVTVAIILIGQHPSVATAVDRCIVISLGILIAALISQFVLPIHARVHLRKNQETTVRQLREYYIATIKKDKYADVAVVYYDVDEKLAKSLIAQRKLAVEAAKERLGRRFNPKHFSRALWCEKEIFRSINFMYHAYAVSSALKKTLAELPEFNQFNDGICDTLKNIADCLENQKLQITIPIPNILAFKTALLTKLNTLSETDLIRGHAFLFCAEILVERCKKLARLVVQ